MSSAAGCWPHMTELFRVLPKGKPWHRSPLSRASEGHPDFLFCSVAALDYKDVEEAHVCGTRVLPVCALDVLPSAPASFSEDPQAVNAV